MSIKSLKPQDLDSHELSFGCDLMKQANQLFDLLEIFADFIKQFPTKDVLEQNEGTGLHQNVLFGRAGEIYKRIQTSLLYDDDGTEAEEDDDKNRSNKKKALNLPRKNRVIINPEEDFDDDEP